MRPRLVYALHSGNLYGTERMALATAEGVADQFDATILAPRGPALVEARARGLGAEAFSGPSELARRMRPYLTGTAPVALVATGVLHSLIATALTAVARRRIPHLHVVHGGADERESYGRKRLLNRLPITFVAVSGFVRDRLVAHGVRADRIVVIENFLAERQLDSAPRRPGFREDGVRRAVVVSRVDPIKRVDLLLDALDRAPELADLEVDVLGTGWDLERLRERAAARHPNVHFRGFDADVPAALARADLLVHTCPEEPFGLAILEAMAAGIPVLVPDSGGAASLVEPGVSGLRFRRDDPSDLAAHLRELRSTSAARLTRLVEGGRRALADRFSARARIDDYRRLLGGALA